jgi:polysaccharide export outer membrane protein
MKTLLLAALLFAQAPTREPLADYAIGPQDLLLITVVGEAELTRPYRVGNDGFLDFPWVGRVQAQGVTRRGLEAEIVRRLTEGKFLVSPQVTVEVQEFRSQSVYVQGEVNLPGEYPLTGTMTLVDVLAKAVLKPSAGEEIQINRRKAPAADPAGAPLPAGASDVEVIRIPKGDIQTGRAARTVALRNGDTIFVPKAVSIYVMGQVRTPGPYTMEGEITVLQAIALAGGPTDKAATNRTTILRLIDGEQQKLKVKLTDIVRPGDTIEVPARWF